VLLAAALAAGGCLRAHDNRQPAAPAKPPAAAAPSGPAQAAPPAVLSLAAEAATPPPTTAVDFASQVRPVLEARCQPCHFAGGKMYDRLPFDDPATIRHLGERLFTRIKAEDEQALIRAFLAQEAHGR
jgi:hypothetical protein